MATNKRKEAAALFELIGKSTLKVPQERFVEDSVVVGRAQRIQRLGGRRGRRGTGNKTSSIAGGKALCSSGLGGAESAGGWV